MYAPAFGIPLQASTNIYPSRFVTISGQFSAKQSQSGDVPIGVSGEFTRRFDSDLHAMPGEIVKPYTPGSVCQLEIASDVTAGTWLKPDNDGKGVPAASGDVAGALALENGSAGMLIRVLVFLHNVS